MKLKDIILEARKNPKKNPKISINDTIEQHYHNAPLLDHNVRNSFVSFTEIEKLGVNPMSRYATPYGIYCYPSYYILNSTSSGSESIFGMDSLPFAGSHPYGNIFSIVGNILYIDNMTIKEYETYINKLRKILKTQYSDYPILQEILTKVIDRAPSEAKHPTFIGGQFWYIMWKMSTNIAIETHKSKGPIVWNALFRRLGIDAVIDKGVGIIHQAEPTQAVIFSIKNIKDTIRVDNKYSQSKVIDRKDLGSLVKQGITNIENLESYEIMQLYHEGQPNIIKYIKNEDMIKKLLKRHPAIIEYVKNPILTHLEYAVNDDLETFILLCKSLPKIKALVTDEFVTNLIKNYKNFISMHMCIDLCELFPHFEYMLYALAEKNVSMVLHSEDIMDSKRAAKVKQYAKKHNLYNVNNVDD